MSKGYYILSSYAHDVDLSYVLYGPKVDDWSAYVSSFVQEAFDRAYAKTSKRVEQDFPTKFEWDGSIYGFEITEQLHLILLEQGYEEVKLPEHETGYFDLYTQEEGFLEVTP